MDGIRNISRCNAGDPDHLRFALMLWGFVSFFLSNDLIAQIKPGTYASIHAYEKVCLRISPNQRFSLFSSNCTTDRDYEGSTVVSGDTLILQTDIVPSVAIIGATETSAIAERAVLIVQSEDAALLRGMRIQTPQETHTYQGQSELRLKHPIDSIRFTVPGLPAVTYKPIDSLSARVQVDFRFLNLDKPTLINDRWLINGNKLRYLPGPTSARSAEIELKRGKRCFYKP